MGEGEMEIEMEMGGWGLWDEGWGIEVMDVWSCIYVSKEFTQAPTTAYLMRLCAVMCYPDALR